MSMNLKKVVYFVCLIVCLLGCLFGFMWIYSSNYVDQNKISQTLKANAENSFLKLVDRVDYHINKELEHSYTLLSLLSQTSDVTSTTPKVCSQFLKEIYRSNSLPIYSLTRSNKDQQIFDCSSLDLPKNLSTNNFSYMKKVFDTQKILLTEPAVFDFKEYGERMFSAIHFPYWNNGDYVGSFGGVIIYDFFLENVRKSVIDSDFVQLVIVDKGRRLSSIGPDYDIDAQMYRDFLEKTSLSEKHLDILVTKEGEQVFVRSISLKKLDKEDINLEIRVSINKILNKELVALSAISRQMDFKNRVLIILSGIIFIFLLTLSYILNRQVALSSRKASETQSRLDLALQSAKIGIWDWHIPSNSLKWDDTMFEIYDVDKNDFSGAYDVWQSAVHKDDVQSAVQNLNDAVQEKIPMYDKVFRINTSTKGLRYIVAKGILRKDRNGNPLIMSGVNYDITDIVQLDKQKTQFVSLASHQLLTPLSALNWHIESIEDGEYGKITDSMKQSLKVLKKTTLRMVNLVNALLNVSRVEMGSFIVEPQKANICTVLDGFIKEVNKGTTKKIDIIFDKPKKSMHMNIDLAIFGMLVENVLSNAVKYSPEGSTIRVNVRRKYSNKKFKYIRLVIADEGYGIPYEQQSKVFTKLFRADNIQTMETNGNGLGLYLVKSLMESIGGKVSFVSKEGKGTTFYLDFPKEGMSKRKGTRRFEQMRDS